MRRQYLGSALIGCAFAGLMLGCGTPYVTHVPKRVIPVKTSTSFKVGVAREDLTPIPGVPLGGYSGEAKVSRGFWTRLYARAIYLEQGNRNPLVLVSADLTLMPAALADRVVELLHEETTAGIMPAEARAPLKSIGRENLLLAATESHQSPGNFLSSRFYNMFASPFSGFDEELFEFLAHRITIAIKRAHHARQDAAIRTSHGSDAEKYYLDEFVRNRSFDAFLLNAEAKDWLADNGEGKSNPRLSACPVDDDDWPRDEYPNERACRAVNARVDVLQFLEPTDDPSEGKTIGVAVFAAAHITVLDADTEVYSGDVFGLAARMLEERISKDAACGGTNSAAPVVAIFNGAQGDVSLQWRRRTRAEAENFAERLVGHVCEDLNLANEQLRDMPEPYDIRYGFAVEDVKKTGPFEDQDERERATTRDPNYGAGNLGGGEEQRTLYWELGMKEGRRHYARREHGAKHAPFHTESGNPLGEVGRTFLPPPHRAPLGVYQIGDVALVGFPSEATTIMGFRIREAVAKKLGLTVDQVLFVNFANGHISYVTTPQEYDSQTYEGASNYWGAATGPYLKSKLAEIAGTLDSGESAPPMSWDHECYKPGTRCTFEPRNAWGSVWDPDEGLANIVRDAETDDPKRDFPTFCWRDAIPSLELEAGSPGAVRSVPDVRIREADGGQTLEVGLMPQDNQGVDLVTVMVGISSDETEWCGIWLRPASGVPGAQCEFEVDPIYETTSVSELLTSQPFQCDTGIPPVERPKVPLEPPTLCDDNRILKFLKFLGLCSDACG